MLTFSSCYRNEIQATIFILEKHVHSIFAVRTLLTAQLSGGREERLFIAGTVYV